MPFYEDALTAAEQLRDEEGTPVSDYAFDFLCGDDVFPVSRSFVEDRIIPRMEKIIGDYGDGWVSSDVRIHTREIAALICVIKGKCKD